MIPSDNSPHHNDAGALSPVDQVWFTTRFTKILDRLDALESTLSSLEETLATNEQTPAAKREYYSIAEFAELVGRSEYTVREWCRLERIIAEKADSGRGDAKSWKIPVGELTRYRDHGLLPLRYR